MASNAPTNGLGLLGMFEIGGLHVPTTQIRHLVGLSLPLLVQNTETAQNCKMHYVPGGITLQPGGVLEQTHICLDSI